MRKIIYILLVIPFFAYTQLPKDIIWQNCYGTSEPEKAMDLLETQNAYYILSETEDIISSNSAEDILLTKIKKTGELIWQKAFGGSLSIDFPANLIKDDNGYIYIGGSIYSSDNFGGYDAWVIKIDTSGTIIWEKKYGGSMTDYSVKLLSLNNGNLLMYMATFSSDYDVDINYGFLDIWIAEITTDGDIVNSKVFGSTKSDNIFSLIQTSDGGFFTAARAGANDGVVNAEPRYGDDVWLLKLDAQLNIEWQKLIGGSHFDAGGLGVAQLEDGGYIINATTQSSDMDVYGFDFPDIVQPDLWVVRIDSIGNIIWNIALGGDNFEHSSRIFPNEDGTFTVFGSTSSPNNGDVEGKHHLLYNNPNNINEDIWMVHLSEDGEILDQRCFGNASVTSIYRGIIKKSDYHYLLAGSAYARPANPEEPEVPTDGEVYSGYTSTSKDIWFFEIVDCEYFQPEVPANIEGKDSVCTLNTTESTYTTQIINPQYEDAEWQILPAEAGELTNMHDSAIILWNTSFEGQVELRVRSTSNCGESDYSVPKLIEVRSCVGVGEIYQRELKTYPNPAKTKITFELPIITKESILYIKDIYGKSIAQIPFEKAHSQIIWDCSTISHGVYFYQSEIDGINYSGKILIQ